MAPSGDLTPKAVLKAPVKVKAAEPVVQVEPAILRKPDAARFMGVSETIFAAQVASKKYPAGRQLSQGSVGWLVSELRACAHALPVSDFLPVRRKAPDVVD